MMRVAVVGFFLRSKYSEGYHNVCQSFLHLSTKHTSISKELLPYQLQEKEIRSYSKQDIGQNRL